MVFIDFIYETSGGFQQLAKTPSMILTVSGFALGHFAGRTDRIAYTGPDQTRNTGGNMECLPESGVKNEYLTTRC